MSSTFLSSVLAIAITPLPRSFPGSPPPGVLPWRRRALLSASRGSRWPHIELCWVLERLGLPLLDLRQYALGKELEASFNLVKRHAGVTEVQHKAVGVDHVSNSRELFNHLVRCSPGH